MNNLLITKLGLILPLPFLHPSPAMAGRCIVCVTFLNTTLKTFIRKLYTLVVN